ncbi:MAG: sulfatase-like hydrolase/transferase, partial [Planctomycetaceae bacterium]|nr:sulfatase-like hydrolase/transferase [Planctomycetaceae bacterium]
PKSKQSPYDGGLRTPIILRWTGHIVPNRDEVHPVSSLDLVPTLLKLAGLEKDASQPGIDLLDKNAVESRKTVFGECFTHDFVDLLSPEKNLRFRWMIEDGWKLIVPQPSEKTGIELYYLPDDPHETKNLAESQPQRLKTMLSVLLNEKWNN